MLYDKANGCSKRKRLNYGNLTLRSFILAQPVLLYNLFTFQISQRFGSDDLIPLGPAAL